MYNVIYENSKGVRFVHRGDASDPHLHIAREELWNLATGEQIYIYSSSLRKMKNLGPDMEMKDLASTDDLEFPSESDLSVLNSHFPYFISLFEGQEPVKNWYEWLLETQSDLAQHLTRADYLRVKGAQKGAFLLKAMSQSGLKPSKISPRYFWLLGRL